MDGTEYVQVLYRRDGKQTSTSVEDLSGLRKSTVCDYQSYLRKDIGPALGELPLIGLARDHIAKLTQDLDAAGASGKGISNKHGFLSSALNAAVRAGGIPTKPALGQRVPSSDPQAPDSRPPTHLRQLVRPGRRTAAGGPEPPRP